MIFPKAGSHFSGSCSEPREGKRRQVDIRRLAADRARQNIAAGSGHRQPEVPMTEIEPEAVIAAWPDNRQRIGKAWTVPHPERPVVWNLRARKHARHVAHQILGALAVRSARQSAEL